MIYVSLLSFFELCSGVNLLENANAVESREPRTRGSLCPHMTKCGAEDRTACSTTTDLHCPLSGQGADFSSLSFGSAGFACYRSWSLLSDPGSSVEYSFRLLIPCVRPTILPVSKSISGLLVLTFPRRPQLLPEPSFNKKLLQCLCKQPGPSQRGSGEKMRNAPPIRIPFLPTHHLFKTSPFSRAKSAASLSTET